MSPYQTRNRAFTLIELLIVITIIGILAVALIPRLTGGPARARDAQRKSDLQQLATALEFYNTDNNSYPTAPSGNCVASLSLSTSYITSIPTDPSVNAYTTAIANSCSGGGYTYIAVSTDTDATIEGYYMFAHLENSADRGAGVYNANGFTVQAPSTSSAMYSTTTVLTSTSTGGNGSRLCYGTTNCTGATDVLFAVGR